MPQSRWPAYSGRPERVLLSPPGRLRVSTVRGDAHVGLSCTSPPAMSRSGDDRGAAVRGGSFGQGGRRRPVSAVGPSSVASVSSVPEGRCSLHAALVRCPGTAMLHAWLDRTRRSDHSVDGALLLPTALPAPRPVRSPLVVGRAGRSPIPEGREPPFDRDRGSRQADRVGQRSSPIPRACPRGSPIPFRSLGQGSPPRAAPSPWTPAGTCGPTATSTHEPPWVQQWRLVRTLVHRRRLRAPCRWRCWATFTSGPFAIGREAGQGYGSWNRKPSGSLGNLGRAARTIARSAPTGPTRRCRPIRRPWR
ncbi:hypothetical protein BKA19_0898 [Blastococcus saxobsidens]|uniref:Uncharacterized protein n=1 Tax=Blastococcus saxobsidens TaxID=138336 RepID=A0A4Q7Y577_9ACTN|nr:hypothetical protein BKA19_0898 [Blastococcus saxobsidens]